MERFITISFPGRLDRALCRMLGSMRFGVATGFAGANYFGSLLEVYAATLQVLSNVFCPAALSTACAGMDVATPVIRIAAATIRVCFMDLGKLCTGRCASRT